MYEITEKQLNTLSYILDCLTVTGPEQGGLLNNAAGILIAVRNRKIEEDKKGVKP